MESLKRTLSQIRDLWESFSPSQKGTYTVLLVFVLGSLGIWSYKGSGSNYVSLFGDQPIPLDEIRDIEYALRKAGKADWFVKGNSVMVPAAGREELMEAASSGIAGPYDLGKYADSRGFLDSPAEARHARNDAKKEQIGRLLRKMSDIEFAVVNWSEPESVSRFRGKAKRTATVTVRPRGPLELKRNTIRALKLTVANAVDHLSVDDVVVTDLVNGKSYSNRDESPDEKYLSLKKQYAADLTSKLEDALSYIDGVAVTADVVLGDSLGKYIRQTTHDDKTPYPLLKKSETVTREVNDVATAGEPGERPNNAFNLTTAGGSRKKETVEESRQETIAEFNKRESYDRLRGLKVLSSKATITIPQAYYRALAEKEGTPKPEAAEDQSAYRAAVEVIRLREEDKAKQAVPSLIQPPAGGNPEDTISIVSVETVDPPPLPGESWFSSAGSTLSQWTAPAGLAGFALFALWMIGRSMKQDPAAEAGQVQSLLSPDLDDEPEEREAEPEGPTRRDDVQVLVRDNPEMAATVLSRWVASS